MHSTILKNVVVSLAGIHSVRGERKRALSGEQKGALVPFAEVLNRQSMPSVPVSSILKSVLPLKIEGAEVMISPKYPGSSAKVVVPSTAGKAAVKAQSFTLIPPAPGSKSGGMIVSPNMSTAEAKAQGVVSITGIKTAAHTGRYDEDLNVKPTQPAFVPQAQNELNLKGVNNPTPGFGRKPVNPQSGRKNLPAYDVKSTAVKAGSPLISTEISALQMDNPDRGRSHAMTVLTTVENPYHLEQMVTIGLKKAQPSGIGVKGIQSLESVHPDGFKPEIRTPEMPPEKPRVAVHRSAGAASETKAETAVSADGKPATVDLAGPGKQEPGRIKPILIELPEILSQREGENTRAVQLSAPKTGDTFAAPIKNAGEAFRAEGEAVIAKNVQASLRPSDAAIDRNTHPGRDRTKSDTRSNARNDSTSVSRPDSPVLTEVKSQAIPASIRGRGEAGRAKLPSAAGKDQNPKSDEKTVSPLNPQALKDGRHVPKEFLNLQETAVGRKFNSTERTARVQHLALLADKVRAQARLLRPGGEAVFETRLSPPDLGSIRVRLSVLGEEIRLTFTADRAEAVCALQEARTELTSLVAAQGYTLAQCEIEGRLLQDRWQQPGNLPSGRSGGRDDRLDEGQGDDREEKQDSHRPLNYGYNTLDLVA